MDYESYFKGKRITLMGLGLLGRGVGDARFLAECGAELIVTDLKSEEMLKDSLTQLSQFKNITYRLGKHELEDFCDRDLIVKAAGVPLDSPFIAEAHKNKIPVRMSADLFAELVGVPVVGVTGTRGKSTVTHMIAHILETAGMKVVIGGNVRGVSTLSQLKVVVSDTIAVLELDSWQLQGFGEAKLSPHIAVFTTFFPDHMNYYHDDMKVYFADKANIFLRQSPEDTFVLGGQVAPFIKEYGYEKKVAAHTFIANSKNLPKQWKLQLPGEHNRYNAGLAVAAAAALGVDTDVIYKAVTSFKGVEGRLQFLSEKNGVKIYNDNNATTPEATVAALRALGDSAKKNIILIMGGSDKGLVMSELVHEISNYCKKVLLLAGTGTERVKKEIPAASYLIYQVTTDAVRDAFNTAEAGDIVLFSPAFASFGMFKNEYDRNDQFVKAVSAL